MSKRATVRLPPLVMVRAFEAVGRLGTMRRAAEDIGVSHTVVSRHVRNLELWMGRKLVRTGPRGVDLTSEGEIFLAAVSRAFGLMAQAVEELGPPQDRRHLRIWCIPGLATRWLTPRLSALKDALGSAVIELRATDAKPDFGKGEADALVGFSVLDSLPDGAVWLARPRMFPVVSPDWLMRHPRPETLADLSRSALIHEGTPAQWASWFAALGEPVGHALSGLRLSDASIGLDAALAGQGIALVNQLMASDEFARGRIVELFETNVELGTYYMLTAPGRPANSLVAAFKDWTSERIGVSMSLAPWS